MPRFLDLPMDVIISIAGSCSSAELNYLGQSCRALRNICTPQLYETIDLSSHNAQIDCEPWAYVPGQHRLVPPDFVSREWTGLDEAVFRRQGLIERTLAANSTYGAHVRTLRWTVLNTSGQLWGEEIRADSDDGDSGVDSEDVEVYTPEDEPIWAIFRSMKNASSADICWLREWREVTLPGPLFPLLRSLRLSGCMSYDLVLCFFGPDLRSQNVTLEFLDLNNVFEWSKIDPPPPSFTHLRDFVQFVGSNSDNLNIRPDRRPMLGHVDTLVGHLSALRHLRIGTIGNHRRTESDPHEDLLYASWARLLGSVRSTLEQFEFEQGFNRNDESNPRDPQPGILKGEARAMDRAFVEHMLPVLVAAPWPRMRRMRICGVGRTTLTHTTSTRPIESELTSTDEYKVREVGSGDSICYEVEKTLIAVPLRLREQLRELLGERESGEVIFEFEEEQGRDWEYLHLGETGIPESR